jgi:translation initiation factor 5B
MAKKDKKKSKKQDDDWDTPSHEDSAAAEAPNDTITEGGIEVAEDPVIDDLADDFGGLMSAIKKTKGKKGKKQQVEMFDANEELEVLHEMPSTVTNEAPEAVEKEDDEAGGEFRVKSKKEKEKEKKEKEKAKKKAQVLVNLFMFLYEGR